MSAVDKALRPLSSLTNLAIRKVWGMRAPIAALATALLLSIVPPIFAKLGIRVIDVWPAAAAAHAQGIAAGD
jgi:hypothetical protein